MRTAFQSPDVEAKYQGYAKQQNSALLALRELVFETAANTPDCGTVVEALKWGQPSFLTEKPNSGSTIRLDALSNSATGYAMYFHCQSGLVQEFRRHYSNSLEFATNRAIIFDTSKELPVEAVRHCLSLALTHHARKRKKKDA